MRRGRWCAAGSACWRWQSCTARVWGRTLRTTRRCRRCSWQIRTSSLRRRTRQPAASDKSMSMQTSLCMCYLLMTRIPTAARAPSSGTKSARWWQRACSTGAVRDRRPRSTTSTPPPASPRRRTCLTKSCVCSRCSATRFWVWRRCSGRRACEGMQTRPASACSTWSASWLRARRGQQCERRSTWQRASTMHTRRCSAAAASLLSWRRMRAATSSPRATRSWR
mmetsp:Transcript_30015/g.89029  ORF Transcript_30015/g.89029 Transcript_30015/m.89029 type:complete len:223 (-) Transcript_30015:1441-2109(-)